MPFFSTVWCVTKIFRLFVLKLSDVAFLLTLRFLSQVSRGKSFPTGTIKRQRERERGDLYWNTSDIYWNGELKHAWQRRSWVRGEIWCLLSTLFKIFCESHQSRLLNENPRYVWRVLCNRAAEVLVFFPLFFLNRFFVNVSISCCLWSRLYDPPTRGVADAQSETLARADVKKETGRSRSAANTGAFRPRPEVEGCGYWRLNVGCSCSGGNAPTDDVSFSSAASVSHRTFQMNISAVKSQQLVRAFDTDGCSKKKKKANLVQLEIWADIF